MPKAGLMPVYPRVGGGTSLINAQSWPNAGLSPRGRGNPSSLPCLYGDIGSIPAWAGEPFSVQLCPARVPVYPRVGGGTLSVARVALYCRGLSPRGRGNHDRIFNRHHWSGSIPAWAGEPPLDRCISTATTVYPRVGGGTVKKVDPQSMRTGLSPRGRGNPENPRA